jgi:hypothetical protein
MPGPTAKRISGIVAVLVIIVVAAAIYLAAPQPAAPVATALSTPSPLPAPTPTPASSKAAPTAASTTPTPLIGIAAVQNPGPPSLSSAPALLPWESQVMQVLNTPSGPSGKARQLFALLRTLPPEALTTTTERAVEWVQNSDYQSTAGPVIVDPHTHGAVLSVLFSDLMDRPDQVSLPTLLDIARTPDHPFAPFARDNLAQALGQDFQSNWGQWSAAIHQRLQP